MSNLEKQVITSGGDDTSTKSGSIRVLDEQDRILIFDGAHNIALFGKDDAGDIVVKIAKSGFNANEATDENLIFNSEQNIFKIVKKVSGSFSLNATGGRASTLLNIDHNMGYPPLILASVNITSSPIATGLRTVPDIGVAISGAVPGSFVIGTNVTMRSNTNNTLTFDIGSYAGVFAGTVTCYILQETAT